MNDLPTHEVIRTLATFRRELRAFLYFSEKAALGSGLTPQQHQTLLAIHGSAQQELSVGEVAEVLILQPHSASELISRLENAGLVERLSGSVDARQKTIRLTEKAIGLLETLSAIHQSELRRLRPLLVKLLSSL